MIALDDPQLLDTEFVDWLIESDHLTKEQKKEYLAGSRYGQPACSPAEAGAG